MSVHEPLGPVPYYSIRFVRWVVRLIPMRLTARRVRRARRYIAQDAGPARWGIRHSWEPLRGRAGIYGTRVHIGPARHGDLYARCKCGREE